MSALKNKTNQPDGSYASGDLYQKSKTTAHAWRYSGRADDVLVLSNGEKVSPGNFESVLRASPLVNEIVIFGSNRPSICAFVFVNESVSDPNSREQRLHMLKELRPALDAANASAPTYAQLHDELIHFSSDLDSLPRTSKGTVRRSVAEKQYNDLISTLFSTESEKGDQPQTLDCASASVASVATTIQDIIAQVARQKPSLEQDLFDFGLNSLQAMRARAVLVKATGLDQLGSNVVFEYPSCALYVRFVTWQSGAHDLILCPQAGRASQVEQHRCFGSFQREQAKGDARHGRQILLL